MCKGVSFPLALYEREICFLTLSEEYRLRVSDMRIFGLKEDEVKNLKIRIVRSFITCVLHQIQLE